jgi:Arabinose-binding domain of AraC transcription regulator, N-term
MTARSNHRAADISVERETQFGPATSRPDQRAKPPAGLGVAASDTLAVQSGEAGAWLRPEACADVTDDANLRHRPARGQTQRQGERGASVLALSLGQLKAVTRRGRFRLDPCCANCLTSRASLTDHAGSECDSGMLLIDTILLAAAAAGVEDAARIDALRVGGSARTAGSRQPGRVSEAAPLWPRAELAQLAGSHRVGAELARFASCSAWVPAEPTPFKMFAEVTAGAASLADAFEHVARFARLVHQGVTVEIDTNDRCFSLTYRRGQRRGPFQRSRGCSGANAHLALLLERAFGVPLRPASAELACSVVDDASGVIADVFGTHVTFGTAEWRLVVAHKFVRSDARRLLQHNHPPSRHSLGN